MNGAAAEPLKKSFYLPSYYSSDEVLYWGPKVSDACVDHCLGPLEQYPFEPTAKQERIGRVCDFTYAATLRARRDGANYYGEEDFQLVDSKPLKLNKHQNRFVKRAVARRNQLQKQQQQQQQQYSHQQQHAHINPQTGAKASSQTNKQLQQQAQRHQQWQRTNRQRQLAEWSIEPQQDWVLIDTRPLNILPKLFISTNSVKYEDFDFRGELRYYDKSMDKVLPKSQCLLKEEYSGELTFYWPSTSDDPLLVNRFKDDPTIDVAATDQILACLMAAAQSRLSWHIILQKFMGKLFMDKTNGSTFDLITVDETSKDPPLADDPVKINRPAELMGEAYKINQNISQNVLLCSQPPAKVYEKPPFVEENDKPAPKLYRYRIVTVPPQVNEQSSASAFSKRPIRIVTRSEIDALLSGTETGFLSVKALNEYSPNKSGKSWRAQLESQKGALIAQETKNNHCKVGKWVSQAMIAGCESIKIAFVTRNAADNNQKHSILNVQTYKVQDLGVQIGLQEDNAWGIVRGIVDLIMSLEDGKYTLVKDPVKPEIKLYQMPAENQQSTSQRADPADASSSAKKPADELKSAEPN